MGNLSRSISFLHPWVGDSLTPYWIFSLGVAAGLVVLCLLWGIAYLLSRIPAVGALAEKPGPRSIAALVVAALIFAVAAPWCWQSVVTAGVGNVSDQYESLALWLGLLAAASVILGFAAVMLVGRRAVDEVPLAIREGVLWPIFIICLAVAAFGVFGITTVKEPAAILASLPRLPYMGVAQYEQRIPEATVGDNEEIPAVPVEVSFLGDEVQRLAIDSDTPLEVSLTPFGSEENTHVFKVLANDQFLWVKSQQAANPLPAEQFERLYVRNLGSGEAAVRFSILSAPQYPEVSSFLLAAAAVCSVFLLYLLHRSLMPKLSAVALATTKSEVAQPMFLLLLIGGVFLLVAFVYLPYNTFGEDIKMLKESGLVLITVLGLIQGVWAASNSVADEIEGKTALTVLSKPIGRRDFILGKYLGIIWTVFLLAFVLGLVFMVAVGYKPIYDARESAAEGASWQQCHYEMVRILPGLPLVFMEVAVLAALSVAISTRLPMLANFLICFAIFALGHLTPLIAQVDLGKHGAGEIVGFVAQFIATLFPVLDYFKIEAAVAGGSEVPLEYLGWSLWYCLLYGALALLLALVMFEDRDLA